ncbi:MAG TPA: transglycosylase domain-containing protein [Candidatus Nanoarchaeia archaeon]
MATVGFVLFILFLISTAVAFGFFARNLPSPDKLSEHNFQQATKIYDRNGVLLYNVFGEQNRTLVKFDKIPKDLRNATVAIEDKNFYKHRGFDVFGIARAIRGAIFEKKVTGASTLTQQLVKNALLTPERTVTRKIKEFILSIQIERRYTKDEILQMYLNEIPYGGTAWGSEAAANQYFAKHVWELSLVESAILAGLPQSPTAYSPFGPDPQAYIERTKDVLRRMREDDYITKEQEEKAAQELAKVKFAAFGQNIKAPHFSIHVKNYLEEKYGARAVQEGGLRVTTSLDIKLQNMAQKIIADEVGANGAALRMSNAAAVIENTKTGEILAMVGSKDYFAKDIQGNFNVATQGLRQPGSALKPFNYITGFKNGYTPATMFIDVKTDFGGGYAPGNYCDCFGGPMPVRVALGSSRNVPAVKMLGVNGVSGMIATLKDFGITTLDNPDQYGLSLTLGGGAIKLIELANAYAILGNSGRQVSPVVVLKVTDSEGNVIEEYKPQKKPKQVVKAEHAYLINHILADPTAKYLDYGNYWAHRLNFQSNIAVKTGTSEMKIDNWSFGYTPSYVVGIWVGNNDNSPMHPSLSSGITGAAPIYRAITEQVLKGKKIDNFTRPSGVVSMKVDAATGQKPVAGSKVKTEIFAKWQPPPEDNMRVEKRVCKPTGLLANSSCETAGKAITKTYFVMYDPYTKIFNPSFKYCNPCPPTKTDPNVYTPKADDLSVIITLPEDEADVGSSFTVKAQAVGPNTIVAVEFYLDDVLIVTKTSDPYNAAYSDIPAGDHTITVKAYDDSGDSVEDSIDVKVVGGIPLIYLPP